MNANLMHVLPPTEIAYDRSRTVLVRKGFDFGVLILAMFLEKIGKDNQSVLLCRPPPNF